MLVMMYPGASQARTDEIVRLSGEAGLDASVFEDDRSGIIHLSGNDSIGLADQLAELPGVARILPSRASTRPVTSNLRIAGIRPLVTPDILVERLPHSDEGADMVQRTRR